MRCASRLEIRSAPPKVLEPVGRHFGVSDRVLDVLVPEVVEGTAEPVGMLGPAELEQPKRKRPNRLLEHADTAVGPKERKPRQRKMPSPASA